MNRRRFLGGAASLGAGRAMAEDARAAAAQESESKRRIERATAAAMAMQRRDWEQGIFAQAMLEADNREAVVLLTKAAIVQRVRDGRLAVVVSGSPTDPAMGGEAYLRAAEWTADQQIQQAVQGLLDWIRSKAPRSADGVLYHSFGGPEMWSDGFNCAPPFLAAMGLYDEALTQIEGYRMPDHYVEKVAALWQAKGSANLQEVAVAAATLALLLTVPRLTKRVPAPLVAIVLVSFAATVTHRLAPGISVATIGTRFHTTVERRSSWRESRPSSRRRRFPWGILRPHFSSLRALFPAAFAIAMLGAIETLLLSRRSRTG